MMNRALTVVDVSNLYFTIKKRFGDDRRICYKKLKHYCYDRAWSYRMIAYASQMLGKADDFFECLRILNYEVKAKTVKEYNQGEEFKRKANCDIDMVVDAIR